MRRRQFITLLGCAASAPILKPLAAYPQPGRKIPLVGYLWHAGSAEEEQPYYGAIVDGFTRMGYVDGRNIKLEHRFPNEKPELFKSMAAELVALNPDVLMGGAITTSYLKNATSNIPTVSYTHLDVYKRQPLGRGTIDPDDVLGAHNEFGAKCIRRRPRFGQQCLEKVWVVDGADINNRISARRLALRMQSADSCRSNCDACEHC